MAVDTTIKIGVEDKKILNDFRGNKLSEREAMSEIINYCLLSTEIRKLIIRESEDTGKKIHEIISEGMDFYFKHRDELKKVAAIMDYFVRQNEHIKTGLKEISEYNKKAVNLIRQGRSQELKELNDKFDVFAKQNKEKIQELVSQSVSLG